LDGWGFIQAREGFFSSLSHVDPFSFMFSGYSGYFARSKAASIMKMTIYLHTVLKLGMH
jgi:hypothetical protein